MLMNRAQLVAPSAWLIPGRPWLLLLRVANSSPTHHGAREESQQLRDQGLRASWPPSADPEGLCAPGAS